MPDSAADALTRPSASDQAGLLQTGGSTDGEQRVSAVGEDSAVGELPKAWAAVKADGNYTRDPCETYVAKLVQSVEERLCLKLREAPAAYGVQLVGTLPEQAPLRIDVCGQLQTTKEHWRWVNCRASLVSKGLYEAPGSIFWLSKSPPTWEGTVLPASGLTYGMIDAGRLIWSDESFQRSSQDVDKRRYSIRFAIPHQPIRGKLLVWIRERGWVNQRKTGKLEN